MWLRVLLIGCFVMAGCAEEWPSLRARSAGDLHCAAETLKIYKLDERAYRVVGCRQDVVYISVCDRPSAYGERQCTWVVDTARRTPAAEAEKQPATGAPEGGCSFDAQCKGDRICVQKQCVAPPSAPAPSSAPPS
jgi:hypothetical protein